MKRSRNNFDSSLLNPLKDIKKINIKKKDNKPDEKKDNKPDEKKDIKPNEKKDDNLDLMTILDIIFIGGGGSESPPHKPMEITQSDPMTIYKDKLCKNPLCDHKDFSENPEKIEISDMSVVNNIDDLITLGKSYHCKKNKEYNGINLRLMCNLVAPLTELKEMIGMTKVKTQIVNQILFFLQGFNRVSKCGKCQDCVFNLPCPINESEMLHTVITGPPGVGKTQLGKILGRVYRAMGILANDTFKLATRSDLIAEYLGQTTMKTQKVINQAKGGVLFLDEVYALGNAEGRDSFAKECIDTLNQNLSEKRDFLCIIAGYKDQIESCFFKYNEGLRRRFTFKYEIDSYNFEELMQIFELKARKEEWSLFYDKDGLSDEDIVKMRDELKAFFSKNYRAFPNYGGDIETLLLQSKIAHSRNLVPVEEKRVLTMDNIKIGFANFSSNRKNDDTSKSGNKYNTSGMYEVK